MKSNPRIFTLEEANGLLPEVGRRLSQILEKKEEYARRHDEVFMHELLKETETHAVLPDDQTEQFEREIHSMETAILGLEKELREIRALGCVLRNLERGFVDFPSRHSGEWIYYCWRLGEASIQYYHTAEGRQTKRIRIDF